MSSRRVVVTGVGIICGLGRDKREVFQNMLENKTGIGVMTAFPTDMFISSMGAEVKEYRAEEYFTPAELQKLDPCAQYAIIAAKEALADSGVSVDEQGSVGVAIGTCNGGINSLEAQGTLTELDVEQTSRYPFYYQGDSVAQYFQFKGPVNTINTACAASGNAIGFAYDMIAEGYADVMVAGGSDSMSVSVYAGFNALQALNPQPCSPYNDVYGLSLGEGAAFVILEPLEKALARGATIYAEICGYGLSSDAYHETAPDPSGRGIQYAVEVALRNSGVEKEQIGYINTHGTGTKANDPAELTGLRDLFGAETFAKIPLSSSKAYFGHNLGAAAAIEYVTTLLAMQEGLLPATLHFNQYRDGVGDVNLIANEMLAANPEYFLCNNSAFGGHNASILSRNWKVSQGQSQKAPTSSKKVVVVGAGTVNSLGHTKGSLTPLTETDAVPGRSEFQLKVFKKDLYERRMNRLAQFSIAAAHLALEDANLLEAQEERTNFGLMYGTSLGSMESATKYIGGIYSKGLAHASSIYFPDMVLNSTAGKVAMKLNIKGYSSSLSTGGNEGLMTGLYGYEVVKNGISKYCLVGAGDEVSELSGSISQANGLDSSRFAQSEGSSFLVLTDLETAQAQGMNVYAEIQGFGITFTQEGDQQTELKKAVHMALERSGVEVQDIDFVLFNSDGRANFEGEESALRELFGSIPVECWNEKLGYGVSTSSLNHLYLAVDRVSQTEQTGLVVSTSINGNNIATVVRAVQSK